MFDWLTRLFGGGGTITGEDARALVAGGAQLVDVRSPAEFASGALPGAVNVPVDALEGRLGEIQKTGTVIVYCQSGMRSARAAAALRAKGYTVQDLGSIRSW